MKNLWSFAAVGVITLFGHYSIYQHQQIKMMESNVELSNRALVIESETIRDLIYENQKITQEKEAIGSQRYVAGVVDAVNKPDYHEKIWHAGYDQGVATQIAAYEIARQEKEESEAKARVAKLEAEKAEQEKQDESKK